ncbi:hypothetical protein B0H16DRAFT_1573527 [Mycena metata]|uniref:Uncharacterized protein n=1 Tax=Mycena metata TaxID=1033252 RepID=A0AAD7MX13_9AGAR|nr:hypothetical protein B0H16DRAFT_1573527 [Mycena metata]
MIKCVTPSVFKVLRLGAVSSRGRRWPRKRTMFTCTANFCNSDVMSLFASWIMLLFPTWQCAIVSSNTAVNEVTSCEMPSNTSLMVSISLIFWSFWFIIQVKRLSLCFLSSADIEVLLRMGTMVLTKVSTANWPFPARI